jgi:2-methylisocitrate lyase-like PEP mutase family enzyme
VVAATFPSLPLFAAALGVRTALRSLKEKNSLSACQDQVLTLEEYYDLVGLKPMLAREEAYDKAAAALTQKRAAE